MVRYGKKHSFLQLEARTKTAGKMQILELRFLQLDV